MLRPATPHHIDRLRAAADESDRDLDTALICLGILPPVDLDPIRAWLHVDGATLIAAANVDGHRIMEIHVDGRVAARIDHAGAIRTYGPAGPRQGLLLSA